MQLRGIAYARESGFHVLNTCTAINNLAVINTAGGNLHSWVMKTLTRLGPIDFSHFFCYTTIINLSQSEVIAAYTPICCKAQRR
ncbi:MAG: hypothetical protein A2030_00935 [Chloroflexi bacterium RBG_19FT_COMBO_50_10]|nr:MAG: hypothetical protein A2030_00935 [Chloroflexi bacterium RBG_19FT_COMBO_50_10]